MSFAQEIFAKIDIRSGLVIMAQRAVLMQGDKNANAMIAALYDGDKELALTGAQASGQFIRPDGVTIPLEGAIDGNRISAVFTPSCYSVSGGYRAMLFLTSGEVSRTIMEIGGQINDRGGDKILDVENIIPSVSDIVAQYATMQEVTQETNAAKDAANAAAQNAQNKADRADRAATLAGSAANNALTQADKIQRMTVSAKEADAAGARISEKDGGKHIDFDLPPGPTPQITFTVDTGAPGTQVEISQGGTALRPEIHLTIPRGDTGAVDGVDYYAGTPSALGTASPGMANGLARGDHVHPMPTASNVGALGKNEQAADSAKLGGKTTAQLINMIYPVGSVYMAVNEVDPAALFGGVWERIKDRFLLGAGDGYAAGETGGAATVTLTASQIPAHTHKLSLVNPDGTDGSKSTSKLQYGYSGDNNTYYTNDNAMENTGGGAAHNNMPPYLAVYMWKRVS